MTDQIAENEPDQPAAEPDQPFLVGVGASAGGLEAIIELVKALPEDANAAYVVVQHLSPQHRSLLTTLIGREAKLPVIETEDGALLEARRVYVTPPNHDVMIADGRLKLTPPSQEIAAPKPSVDRFFVSAAEAFGERAVGVVLSGTGSDGAYGVQAIRAAGGVTIAQDSESAKYDGMPMAALETGCVDLTLRPGQIGAHLGRIMTFPRDLGVLRATEPSDQPLGDLLQIMLARTRVDFREYKASTVQRRVERRMTALGIDNLDDYTRHCRTSQKEVAALLKDLLISVTRFFRDPREFEALRTAVRRMVADRKDAPLRIWVAGCATGEEAYSIAMVVADALGGPSALQKDQVQIFATDIDEDALRVARTGRYSRAAMDDVPEAYVDAYFHRHDDGVQVIRQLRDVVLISRHNVCQDPPFINIDLVCCRNLMIYFNPQLQRKVLRRLHYALRQNGLLFLGTAESAGAGPELFAQISDRARIFRRRALTAGASHRVFDDMSPRLAAARPEIGAGGDKAADDGDRALFQALARALGPDALVLSSDMRILRVFGDIGRYVSLTEGTRLSMTVAMLRQPFASEARSLSVLALRDGKRRRGGAHRIETDPGHVSEIEVLPLAGPELDEGVTLVIFHRSAINESRPAKEAAPGDGEAARRITALQHEVESTREALQQTVEELETSNEELQSLNEELQSTNEELQASNEELETANEELQSTNEELVTVNEELEVNVAEKQAATDDLNSVLENIPIPTLVIDASLQITRASRAAAELFSIKRVADRPHLSQCATPSEFPNLAEICAESLRLGTPITRDIKGGEDYHILRCAPFTDTRGRMSGVTLLAMPADGVMQTKAEIEKLFLDSPLMMVQRAADGRILRVSQAKADMLGRRPDQLVGHDYAEVGPSGLASIALEEDADFLASGEARRDGVQTSIDAEGRTRFLKVERRREFGPWSEGASVLAIELDITASHSMSLTDAEAVALLELLQKHTGAGAWVYDEQGDMTYLGGELLDMLGMKDERHNPTQEKFVAILHPEDREQVHAAVEKSRETGAPQTAHFRHSEGLGVFEVMFSHIGPTGAKRLIGVTKRVE